MPKRIGFTWSHPELLPCDYPNRLSFTGKTHGKSGSLIKVEKTKALNIVKAQRNTTNVQVWQKKPWKEETLEKDTK